MLVTESVLARCFLSFFSLVLCFMAGGWARRLLAASVHIGCARRLVELQQKD